MYFAPPNFKTWLRTWIRCSAKCWDESQRGFSFYSVENELLLRIICHTERLKPFQITTGGQKYFRSDLVSFLLLFMGKVREKTRLTSLHCSQDIQWSKMLTVCDTECVQAGYVLWLQLFCSIVVLSHSDLLISSMHSKDFNYPWPEIDRHLSWCMGSANL